MANSQGDLVRLSRPEPFRRLLAAQLVGFLEPTMRAIPTSSTDPVGQLLAEAPLFARLKHTMEAVNESIITTTSASPAQTLRPGQAAPATHQSFTSINGDWLVLVDTLSGPDAGLRWMHTVTSAKVVPGFSLGLLRTNASMDAKVTAAPALDVEVGLFNNASILFYLNMPPRVDLLVRQPHFASLCSRTGTTQAEADEEYYHRYYMQPVIDGMSYDTLMAAIASDPDTTPFRSKSVHIRVYAATGALVTVRITTAVLFPVCSNAYVCPRCQQRQRALQRLRLGLRLPLPCGLQRLATPCQRNWTTHCVQSWLHGMLCCVQCRTKNLTTRCALLWLLRR